MRRGAERPVKGGVRDEGVAKSARPWCGWLAAGALTVLAPFAATYLVGSICYFQGRMWSQHLPYELMAWRREDAPVHLVVFLVGALWAAGWLLQLSWVRRSRWSLAQPGAPMLAFLAAMFWASANAYACFPY